ncbi:MAG: NAD(P)H-dependent glycerol-3-phosphate dehydrogenase [Chitinivibrionales bacterium]|nr:NAD(P)H-dependent glycerol-3-phosphate dehydrogenase [Chitinivibrionales bacterium]MBD3358635.1 NAD(P)H-dependent glycerol-3-phosphate dehydrogenase [Chitinivibrionales bacterium]
MNVTILGGGSWGIALAVLLRKSGHKVRMWEFNEEDAQTLARRRQHPMKLPGIMLPEDIVITSSLTEALKDAEYATLVVPSQAVRAAIRSVASLVSGSTLAKVRGWVIATKGIECATLKLMHEILLDEIPDLSMDKIVVLSGPSHAEEVSRMIPTTVVAASENNALAVEVQQGFGTDTFRIYTNNDVTGVELCAGVKNVIAVAAGISDGLGFGDNTKGALLTRGMAEIVRLGTRMGAQESTFIGLAGFGDLITTCISRHSRNRRIGELIARGMTLQEALGQMCMVAEGVETTRSVFALARRYEVDMPITTEVYKALFEGKPPQQAVRDLMLREAKPES